jgi:hypothetical protein
MSSVVVLTLLCLLSYFRKSLCYVLLLCFCVFMRSVMLIFYVIILCVVLPSATILFVVITGVVMLSVVAPHFQCLFGRRLGPSFYDRMANSFNSPLLFVFNEKHRLNKGRRF